MFKKLTDQRGNVTVAWVAILPGFIILALFMGSVMLAWATHSSAQVAADAGSLAATKKLDELIMADFFPFLKNEAIPIPDELNDVESDLHNQEKMEQVIDKLLSNPVIKERFVQFILDEHRDEIANTVRYYVVKNGGDSKGKIIFPVYGRIQVEARKKYEPLDWDYVSGYIEGTGYGPSRLYLKLLPEKSIEINY